jgi:RluA family pseudouridine synthase
MIFNSTVPFNIKPGTDVVSYLSKRFTYYSFETWFEKICEGKISVDGNIANEKDLATPGAIITYDAGEFKEPEANLNYKIIYEDEWFLGIDKPGNLLVHRAGKSFRNNLIYQLRSVHLPPFPEAHSTHRLDRDTSGVMLIAKNIEACTAIGNQFAKRAMNKEYIAIVNGVPEVQCREIMIPIGKAVDSTITYKYQADPDGKDAVTLIEECKPIGKKYALLRMRPLTGRTHQIRVHCAAIGHPIVGDKLYSMEESVYRQWRQNPQEFTGVLDFYRHALHCKSIGFMHPYTNSYCTIEASLHKDMKMLIRELKKR